MSLSPYFKSPFTDFTGAVTSHQWGGRCADFELKALDCLEAYGLDRGVRKCEDLIKDFQECSLQTKQHGRLYTMRMERYKQISNGTLKGDDKYAPSPKIDSY